MDYTRINKEGSEGPIFPNTAKPNKRTKTPKIILYMRTLYKHQEIEIKSNIATSNSEEINT